MYASDFRYCEGFWFEASSPAVLITRSRRIDVATDDTTVNTSRTRTVYDRRMARVRTWPSSLTLLGLVLGVLAGLMAVSLWLGGLDDELQEHSLQLFQFPNSWGWLLSLVKVIFVLSFILGIALAAAQITSGRGLGAVVGAIVCLVLIWLLFGWDVLVWVTIGITVLLAPKSRLLIAALVCAVILLISEAPGGATPPSLNVAVPTVTTPTATTAIKTAPTPSVSVKVVVTTPVVIVTTPQVTVPQVTVMVPPASGGSLTDSSGKTITTDGTPGGPPPTETETRTSTGTTPDPG
jgi:hypothetical protein